MRKILLLLFILLAIPAISLGQSGSTFPASPKKATTLAGQISNDGKTFIGSDDEIWTISNPTTVLGHEGQRVSVKCQLSPDRSAIHVFVLKAVLTEAKYVTRPADPVFRR